MTDITGLLPRKRDSHIWARESHEHYVEPPWCSERLFDEERFGAIHDPCCGVGTIVRSAWSHGLSATGIDLVYRGFPPEKMLHRRQVADFFLCSQAFDCVVCNPPFNIASQFAQHALKLAIRKVAMIFPTARLNAAHWLKDTPLRRVWLMSPRPSMPPGHVIAAGGKPGGGKMDYCWLVWERGYKGIPELRWLYRDAKR
jgi:hypothetical protein